jgi:uncharacterized glyoxalase superfamily protein PhnB
MSTIIPYLGYADAAAAIDWLVDAFGLTETMRHYGEHGQVDHAELTGPDGGRLMLGQVPREPADERDDCVLLVVDVADVDAHYARARAAGARIIQEPEEQPYGLRSYRAKDPEGYRWDFGQRVRDVAPEDWGAISAPG